MSARDPIDAKAQNSTVDVNDCPWGQIFTGTREALIAAGLAEEIHFSLKPTKGRRTDRQQHLGRTIEVRHSGRKGIFEIWRQGYTEDEERAAEERKRRREAEAERQFLKLPRFPHGYLVSLLARLTQRYPGMQIGANSWVEKCSDGSVTQCVTFKAPLSDLLKFGLVTEKMMHEERECRPDHYRTNANGDRFSLEGDERTASLTIWTNTEPHERPRIAVHDAARQLKRFMLPRRRKAAR